VNNRLAAMAEINGMLYGVDAPTELVRPTELVTIYCAQCRGKRSSAAIGHVYRTREGVVLYASWDRTLSKADDVRRDAYMLMVFLSEPWPVVMEVDNWLGHCEYHGWRHLPAIEDLRKESRSCHRVSLRC
jgi:hypothetical protein